MLKDMGFFDEMTPPPPAEEPQEYRPPEWMAAPENVLGRFADVGPVLVRGPYVAVTADGFVAYHTGVEFHMSVRTRQPDYEMDPFFRVCRPRSRHGDAPSDVLRLGFQFSDGSKATYGGFRSFRSSWWETRRARCSAASSRRGTSGWAAAPPVADIASIEVGDPGKITPPGRLHSASWGPPGQPAGGAAFGPSGAQGSEA